VVAYVFNLGTGSVDRARSGTLIAALVLTVASATHRHIGVGAAGLEPQVQRRDVAPDEMSYPRWETP